MPIPKKSRAPTAVAPGSAYAYTNRSGDTYYLHEGLTKTGKKRYFVAKTVGVGALAGLPDGYELTESVNGVVSVRRCDTAPSLIPEADVRIVRAEVERHAHLAHHKVELRKNEILIHEPEGGELSIDGLTGGLLQGARWAAYLAERAARARYRPVMKFVPGIDEAGSYRVFRMTYRGDGGWMELSYGPLAKLAARFIPHIGRESFFDLY